MPHKKDKGRSTVSTYGANHPVKEPKLGSGMAEEARKDLKTRGSRIDKAVNKATGRKKKKENY